MYSLRKHIISFLFLILMTDIAIIIMRILGLNRFDVVFFLTAIVTLIHLYWGKSKLYRVLKEEREEVLRKYHFLGKFSTWEWNIIKAASDNQDDLLKQVRNKVILINIVSLLFIPNMLILFNVIKKFN